MPVSIQLQRPKAMFFFYSPLHTVFSAPTVSDTTVAWTTSTVRTTLKTYNLSIPQGANAIRIIVYGQVNGGLGCYVLNIDGVDVAFAEISSQTEVIVIDYTGQISPGARTIRIDCYQVVSGPMVIVSRVYIATGMGFSSTTPATIATITLTYQLLRSGDVRYVPGVRLFIFGNRKTTASMTLTIQEATDIIVGRGSLEAGNDNDKAETFIAIITGRVNLQEGGEFTLNVTLRGAVGASGDLVIITRILARVQLRRFSGSPQSVAIYESGVCEYSARLRLVSVPGGATAIAHRMLMTDLMGRPLTYLAISGSGTDITIYGFKVAVVAPVHFTVDYEDDTAGEGFLEWVQLVVWR